MIEPEAIADSSMIEPEAIADSSMIEPEALADFIITTRHPKGVSQRFSSRMKPQANAYRLIEVNLPTPDNSNRSSWKDA